MVFRISRLGLFLKLAAGGTGRMAGWMAAMLMGIFLIRSGYPLYGLAFLVPVLLYFGIPMLLAEGWRLEVDREAGVLTVVDTFGLNQRKLNISEIDTVDVQRNLLDLLLGTGMVAIAMGEEVHIFGPVRNPVGVAREVQRSIGDFRRALMVR